MSDLVPYITKRFMDKIPENADALALSFRSDVGYLLSILSSERHALKLIHSIIEGRMDFMSNDSNDEARK